MSKCIKCERDLKTNEIGLHKRLINRGDNKCMCITCLSQFFGCSEDLLREKIVHYINQGCTLFVKED